MMLRRIAVVVAVCVLLFGNVPSAFALSVYDGSLGIATIRDDPEGIVLVGYVENARMTEKSESTDFVITKTLKSHPALKGKKVITTPRFIPIPDPKNPPRFLVLGEVLKDGTIDLLRGFTETPALTEYVEGLLKLDAKDRVKALQYAFEYLDHKETDISMDAFAAFDAATDAEIRKTAPKLSAEKLRTRLVARETPPARVGLYAFLLAHHGKAEDVKAIRKILDDPEPSRDLRRDEVLIGYVLLDPKAGYEYLLSLVSDPKTEFFPKYAGLKTLRFYWATRPDVLTKKQILAGMTALLNDADIADMSIDSLRG